MQSLKEIKSGWRWLQCSANESQLKNFMITKENGGNSNSFDPLTAFS
jgi:hypothetical protein